MSDILGRWTDEQRALAVLYGLCASCGQPRTTEKVTVRDSEGNLSTSYGMVCSVDREHEVTL